MAWWPSVRRQHLARSSSSASTCSSSGRGRRAGRRTEGGLPQLIRFKDDEGRRRVQRRPSSPFANNICLQKEESNPITRIIFILQVVEIEKMVYTVCIHKMSLK